MILLAVIFSLLFIGVALVAYGTLVKNRWGVNLSAVSCPRCNTALPRVRQPQSIRHALWGGWTCPVCGTEVDNWGREVVFRSDPNGWWNTFLSRPAYGPATKWVFGAMLLALNIWYDFYNPRGFFIDAIILISLFIWLLKLRKKANHK
jgi:hypothetical protein